MHKKPDLISFQGKIGAFSDMACRKSFPDLQTYPCPSFTDALDALANDKVSLAMIPIDNLIAGRVADIHQLMPAYKDLHIVAEEFIPVHHCLLAKRGAKLEDIKTVYSHVHAIPQCRNFIKTHKMKATIYGDTAGSAEFVANNDDPSSAAIASKLASEIYGLDIIEKDIEDEKGNATRFVILSKTPDSPEYNPTEKYMTSFIFKVRNIPAALYKALGGFATNGINMTKLESYMSGESFNAARFYCDVEGHPENRMLRLALQELEFFSSEFRFLGTYKANDFRYK